ncbi:MAG: glycosyltransferase family protein [Thermoplasmata archaeon]
MKIAFGVCAIGLGHASRSIPIIKKLGEEGHEVTVFSYGRALELLRKEVSARFIEFQDYPLEFTDNPDLFFLNILLNSPLLISSLFTEHELFLKYHAKEKFDMIISDNRYGIFAKDTPSFLITHQLRILNPYHLKLLEAASLLYNRFFTNRFKYVIVPDLEQNSLSGDLSHNLRFLESKKIKYMGPVSFISKKALNKDIDLLVSISGPEPQRSIFEKLVLEQIEGLNVNYFVTLGKPEEQNNRENVRSYLSFEERESVFNRAKIFITRSGYSTIMDLYMIDGKALFVPTPMQPEQEYLSQYFMQKNLFYSVPQKELNIERDLKIASGYHGFENTNYESDTSVRKFFDIVFGD